MSNEVEFYVYYRGHSYVPSLEKPARRLITFLLQPAWLPPLPSVDVTANLPGYIILSGYQLIIFSLNIEGQITTIYSKGLR